MKLFEIYEKYKIPKNLQEHLLRVGAVSRIISEHWNGQGVNKEAITKACILHDIAKPVSFDLTKQAGYGMTPEEISNLKELQELIRNKYGTDEHKAAVEMCKDLGVNEESCRLLENMEWNNIAHLVKENDWASLLTIYFDMRVGPKGILDLADRVENLKERRSTGHNFEAYMQEGKKLEQKIKEKVSIDLNKITDEEINSHFKDILGLEI